MIGNSRKTNPIVDGRESEHSRRELEEKEVKVFSN